MARGDRALMGCRCTHMGRRWFFMMIIEVGLLFGAVALWRQGLLTVGDFVLIQAYLITIFERLVSINRELRRFYDSFADAAEMVAILEEAHEVRDVGAHSHLIVTRGLSALSMMLASILIRRDRSWSILILRSPQEKKSHSSGLPVVERQRSPDCSCVFTM
jgi:ABC-type multidrug transport system fused ATPase/permease subunit